MSISNNIKNILIDFIIIPVNLPIVISGACLSALGVINMFNHNYDDNHCCNNQALIESRVNQSINMLIFGGSVVSYGVNNISESAYDIYDNMGCIGDSISVAYYG